MFFRHIHHFNRRHERFFSQGKVLAAILLKGSMTQSELLKTVGSELPSVDGMPHSDISLSETLSELEKRRLIKHENSGEYKQGDIFSLTKKGKMLAKRFQNLNRRRDRFLNQGKVLMAILRKGPTTQGELLEIVDNDPQHLSETLSVLEKQRSIKRSKQRREVFSLTKTGEMKARRFQIHDLFTRNMSGSLSDEEKDQLTAIITKLHSNTDGEEFSHFHFRGSHFGFNDDHHDHTHGHTGGKGDK
jgi:DNA-binding MarR family transcriptional regulator